MSEPLADLPPSPPHARPLVLLLACLLVLNALMVFGFLSVHIQHRFDITFPEGAVVYGAWQAAHGQQVYEDWRLWPHRFTPYGPALYYPVGWLARLTGHAPFGMFYYLAGRIESLLALLGIGLASAGLARRAGARWPVALVCGFGLLTLWPRVLEHSVSYRPDAPMVFFNLLAVWIALGGLATRRGRWAAVTCLWLAAAFKHSGWAAPLVVGWLAFGQLGWRSAVRWGLIWLVGGVAAAVGLNALTGGMFFFNTLSAMNVGWGTPQPVAEAMAQGWRGWLALSDVLARLILLVALGGLFFLRRREPVPWRALGVYGALSTLVALVQLLKVGSDVNYLLEPFALCGAMAAMLWSRYLNSDSTPRPAIRLALWAAAVLVIAWPIASNFSTQPANLGRALRVLRKPTPQERLARVAGPVLLMEHAFTHPDPEAHALSDPVYYVLMLDRGRLSAEPFLKRLEQRSFGMIALSPVAKTWLFEYAHDRRIAEAWNKNYRPLPGEGYPQLWVPIPRQEKN